MYTRGCVCTFATSLRVIRLRKLAALFLATIVLMTTAAWAGAEASHELAHGAAGTESPLPSEHGKGLGHGCATHLSAHLFAPLESHPAPLDQAHTSATQAIPQPLHALAVLNDLFRPPRLLRTP